MANPKPIYVLYGTDAYLRDAHRQEILTATLGDADPQTCVAVYEADAELAQVLDDLRTLPFLAPRRAVVLRDADAFVSAHRDALEKYCQAPVETATLILQVSSWPKNTRLYKIIAGVGEAIECSLPEKSNLRSFLNDAAKKRGKKIAPDAAELLTEWIGRDLAALDSELEKLSLYTSQRDTITLADVSALVTSTTGPAAFALADALTAGEPRAALAALGGMLTTRGDEFKTFGMIAWHLRRVMRASQMIAAGKSTDAAMKAARVFYNKPKFVQLLKRRPGAKLIGDFRKLLATDRAMKTGTPAPAALQDLVIGLCS